MSKNQSKERSNLIDTHVGARVRIRRKFLGLTQSDLAAALGLTFQQVQKYERGSNRISASKLFETAKTLKAPVAYFFEGYEDGTTDHLEPSTSEQAAHDFLSTSEGIAIAEAFPRIVNAKHRRKLMEFIHTLAEEEA